MEIGHKIRKLRELRNYSQEFMALKLGISQVAYSKIETGQTQMNLQRLEKIAETLEIDPFTLMSFDDKYIFNNHSPHNQGGNIVNHYHNEKEERQNLSLRVKKLEEKIYNLVEKFDAQFERDKK
jgi:transcriptional regulator with XRE-family HTH domain